MKQITTIGLDLAKNVFQIHSADARARRSQSETASSGGPALFREASAVSGRIGGVRRFALLGTRDRGARSRRAVDPTSLCEAIREARQDRRGGCGGYREAVTRKTMRFVPIKSADEQAAMMVLKTRAFMVRQQTQAINALRGIYRSWAS